jgi:dihydrofolate synthase / folylpolyglutamate synthase
MSTAIALLAFSGTEADLCIVEVGMGGHFDCTNVFDAPAVSVITPVDFDHVDKLGPELSNVAWEKAGIIKRGRPCVTARQQGEALSVIEKEAANLQAPLIRLGVDARYREEPGGLVVAAVGQELHLPRPSLFGPHQIDNAALATVAMLTLGHEGIDADAIASGIARATWPARFQELTDGTLGRRVSAVGARGYCGRHLARSWTPLKTGRRGPEVGVMSVARPDRLSWRLHWRRDCGSGRAAPVGVSDHAGTRRLVSQT